LAKTPEHPSKSVLNSVSGVDVNELSLTDCLYTVRLGLASVLMDYKANAWNGVVLLIIRTTPGTTSLERRRFAYD
jgi:hypothetical protein